jgi:glycosyltransferase involved in cell wall biosynthesis
VNLPPETQDSLKILMISDVYFPRINGVSTSIQTFALELLKLGHEVTLIAPDYGEPHQEPFEVIRIPARPVPMDPEDRLMSYRYIKKLVPDLKQRNFDLIHIQTPFVAHYAGLHLAKQLSIKTVETYHTFFEEYLDKYIPMLPSALLHFVARRFSCRQCNAVDVLVSPSNAMLQVLQNYGVTTSASVIPTGIRMEQFSQGDGKRFRKHHSIPDKQPLLLFVGRVALEKNIEFLIDVMSQVVKQLPDALLLITGEGPARDSLQNRVVKQGLSHNIRFMGYLDRQGVLEDCYCAADLFVFASSTETQGLVLLESMALGTPVVSTAVMGTSEVLVDGQGCMVAEEEIEDFTQKALFLMKNETERNELSLSAKTYTEQWSAPVMAQKMALLYQRTIGQWSVLKLKAKPRTHTEPLI